MNLTDLQAGDPVTVTLHAMLVDPPDDAIRISVSGYRLRLPLADADGVQLSTVHVSGSTAKDAGPLTTRERHVLFGMAQGISNAEIGRQLFISEDTVKTHARRVFRKLGARSRAHAVALAFAAGLLDTGGVQ